MAASAYSRRHRLLGSLIALLVVIGSVYVGWLYYKRTESNPLSEDAVITANIVNIAATVPGRIVTLEVAENQKVAKGARLFSIDPQPYRLAVDQARADLKIAEATRDAQMRSISAEQSNAAIAVQQIDRARTNLSLAEQTLARLTPLLPKGYVTAQQVDDARTARDDARTSLAQAIKQSEAADSLISTIDASEALVEARRAALAIAEQSLANTEVFAPHDGRVVGLNISTGEFVAPGQSVFTLINTEAWFASASFRETELTSVAVGDCARLYVLADRSRPVEGRVEGLGWGVISENVVNLPRGLPYVPKSLNWVRIVQPFPVRIRLIDPPEDLMRMGASAVAIVNHGRQC
ncbi:multidrug transporter subunit MdtN [Kaistia dalseonensis]|uniref:Multidrug efflux system membrane fusion protein n=1 Tax=Kaistia dalseonensis TaxID=410840 RepID=A0ABU0H7N7_9HYPH|nr:multidrug transporter subunit MdtN [Kaistia dalseonensis]MCX5495720.1 multidrug transporter subunit MdtN [Kaistia dalseonensis]MDQ0438317.1 multidrug efflux system membrane fusion protein [Kaistia dalseonensis]